MSDPSPKEDSTQNAASQDHEHAPKGHNRSSDAPKPRFYLISNGSGVHVMLQYPYRKLESLQFRVLQLCSRSMQRDLENYFYPLERMTVEIYGGGTFMGELFGQLIDVTLVGNTQYDCLSYTWGTGPWDYAVRLGDSRIAIPQNLYSALKALQLEDEPRLVWVDIVCINQNDSEERKAQVEMMYQIYRGAREVIVDLGYQSDGSENLAGLLEQIRVVIYEECNRDILLHAGQHTIGTLAARGRDRLPPEEDIIWHTFRKFLERPWFTRVWVIQEAIAAKKLTVMCGCWAMKGPTLFTILDVVVEWGLPCLPMHSESQQKWENKQ
jgi:hypothetical protein